MPPALRQGVHRHCGGAGLRDGRAVAADVSCVPQAVPFHFFRERVCNTPDVSRDPDTEGDLACNAITPVPPQAEHIALSATA